MSFFILGLPRSRTAWLANFMTYDGYCCHHEGTNGCYTMEQYKAKLGKYIGDANTGLMLLNFSAHFPDNKVVIIDTSIDASVQYGLSIHGVDFTTALTELKAKLDNLGGLHVPLVELNNHLELIWDYLAPDKKFNVNRANMLMGLDIKVKEPYFVDKDALRSLQNDC